MNTAFFTESRPCGSPSAEPKLNWRIQFPGTVAPALSHWLDSIPESVACRVSRQLQFFFKLPFKVTGLSFSIVNLIDLPPYMTQLSSPVFEWTVADVSFPSFQAMSTVNPPRAHRPVTFPTFQASGSAGSKRIVPSRLFAATFLRWPPWCRSWRQFEMAGHAIKQIWINPSTGIVAANIHSRGR